MIVEFYCPRWGSESIPWELFCKTARDEGYDGIEYGIAGIAGERELDAVWNTAQRAGLKIIAQHYDTSDRDFSRHLDRYCAWLEKIVPFSPVKINSQTGKDYFSLEQNAQLVNAAAGCGVAVVHETHRNKFCFAAHVTRGYLEKIPGLRLTLDASHWVCVAESYLDDQPEAMQLAIARTDHIHARVGYPEGPQVTDPRIGEWQVALEKHLSWWDQAVARIAGEKNTVTIAPEFGPYPYMVNNPATGTPITRQWDVNVYMMKLLRERYR